METKTRIYVVVQSTGKEQKTSLVEAASGPQAIRYASRNLFSAKVASAKDVASMLGQGVKVETATNDEN